MTSLRALLHASLVLALAGCHTAPHPPIRTAAHVNVERFMGDWFVIANIPTFLERGAHNAVERYQLSADGTIATTFTFNADAFDGELKTYRPRGFIMDSNSNAVWGMQFVWPIKADYRIVYVSDDYARTIIGRERRDYAWIMARTPQIAESEYRAMLDILKAEGYDISQVQRVPQQSPGGDNPGR